LYGAHARAGTATNMADAPAGIERKVEMSGKFDPAPFDKYSEASLEAIKADRETGGKLRARWSAAPSLHQI